jgi:hypothetical protein
MSDETRGDSKETPRLLRKNQPHVDDSFCCFFLTEHIKCLLLWTVDCALLGMTNILAQASFIYRWTDKEEA